MLTALLGGAATVAGYLLVWKPLEAVVHDWGECTASLREVRGLDDGITNHEPFTASADGLLTEAQVERFVAVQRQVIDLGVNWENVTLSRSASYRELLTGCIELGVALTEAKAVQVDALNAADFSLDEYRWVRREFFAATGKNLVPFEAPDLPEFALDYDTVSRWREFEGFERLRQLGGSVSDAAAPGVVEANLTLVEPYRAEARAWLVHAMLGL